MTNRAIDAVPTGAPSWPLWPFVAALCFALPVSIALTNAALVALTAAALATRSREHWRHALTPVTWALAAYCAVSLLTSLTGVYVGRSLGELHKDLHKIWALALLLAALDGGDSKEAWLPLALGFALIALVGVVQVPVWRIQTGDWIRARAFVHPVSYGIQICLASLGALCVLFRGRPAQDGPRRALWPLAFLGLMLAALFLNMSRGALLGLIIGYLAACVFEPRMRCWLPWGLIVVAAIVFTWEFVFLQTRSIHWLVTHTDPWRADGSYNPALARNVLWRVALQVFRDHPLVGVGPANYYTVFPRYFQGILDTQAIWGSAHNLYLHQLAERGLLGLAALFGVLAALVAGAWRNARSAPNAWTLWAWSSTVAFLVMNITEVAFQTEQVMTLFLLIWALGHVHRGAPEG